MRVSNAVTVACVAGALSIGGAALAQVAAPAASPPAAPASPPAPPAQPVLKCPANGYAKPLFGGAGDNDGIIRGFEIASPCIAKETIAAADAIGMARGNPVGVKNISTIRFGATGTLAVASGTPAAYSDIDIGMSYAIPATRVTLTTGKSAPLGWVVADGAAWDEGAPGIGGKAASASAVAERSPLMRLTPFGALLSIIEAEGHATVRSEGGRVILSGTSPYDNYPVTVTLDELSRPIAAEVKAEGKQYRATFAGYSDKWEPPYLVVFPGTVVWTVDGKPMANLKITRFNSNPYVVFPVPALVK